MPGRRRTALAAALLAATGSARALEPAHLVAGIPLAPLVLETAGPRCLLVEAWLPQTPDQRARGLMYVESLGEFEGMYFRARAPAMLVMWMKNTPLPLDMIFVAGNGKVAGIARDTVPYSEQLISSGVPVTGVLEMRAGFARQWRVEPGTRVLGP
jgi:hypothetical protein